MLMGRDIPIFRQKTGVNATNLNLTLTFPMGDPGVVKCLGYQTPHEVFLQAKRAALGM